MPRPPCPSRRSSGPTRALSALPLAAALLVPACASSGDESTDGPGGGKADSTGDEALCEPELLESLRFCMDESYSIGYPDSNLANEYRRCFVDTDDVLVFIQEVICFDDDEALAVCDEDPEVIAAEILPACQRLQPQVYAISYSVEAEEGDAGEFWDEDSFYDTELPVAGTTGNFQISVGSDGLMQIGYSAPDGTSATSSLRLDSWQGELRAAAGKYLLDLDATAADGQSWVATGQLRFEIAK